MEEGDFIDDAGKLKDFLDDVQSLANQYGLKQESVDHLEWVKEKIDDYEDRIYLYKALIGGCETSIKMWNYIAKQILELNK